MHARPRWRFAALALFFALIAGSCEVTSTPEEQGAPTELPNPCADDPTLCGVERIVADDQPSTAGGAPAPAIGEAPVTVPPSAQDASSPVPTTTVAPTTSDAPTTTAGPTTTTTTPTASTRPPATTTTAPATPTTTAAPATTTTSPVTTTAPPSTTTTTTTAPPPPPAGSFVSPADVGVSVGASPTGGTHTGNLDVTTDGTVIENIHVDGCIWIDADNTVIRNVSVSCATTYPIKDNGGNGTVVERVSIDCEDNNSKGIYFDEASNFTVDRIHITRCDDQFFIDGGLGASTIRNSVFHNQAPASDAHTDGMQVGTFEPTNGTLTVVGNWWEYNRQGCCENGVLFLSVEAALTVVMQNNFFDRDFGTHIIRCRPQSHCVIENNTLGGEPDGMFIYADSNGGVARCNRLTNGSLVPTDWYSGVQVDDTAC